MLTITTRYIILPDSTNAYQAVIKTPGMYVQAVQPTRHEALAAALRALGYPER